MKFKVKAEICCSRADCPATVPEEVELEETPAGQLMVAGFHVPDDWGIEDVEEGAFTVSCPEHAK